MGFQIDYLPVGDGSKGGDAITLRFGDLKGMRQDQIVMVIDGGTKDSGKQIVEHIKEHYGTDTVDAVLATHPDSDHVSGLTEVLNDLNVGALWMHQPWDLAPDIKYSLNRTYTDAGLTNYVKASLGQAFDLSKIAKEKNIPVFVPFSGSSAFDGMVQILGPSEDYYRELLAKFRSTPPAAESALSKLLGSAYNFAEEQVKKVLESFELETLTDGCEHYSAENSSSVIMLLTINGKKILFTGDADAEALTRAADYSEQQLGVSLTDLHMLHVPHHGSKQNVGPTILNRIRAEKAQISAPVASNKHPHQSVINALIRRGARVFATQGTTVLHSHNSESRLGWGPVAELQFAEEFED